VKVSTRRTTALTRVTRMRFSGLAVLIAIVGLLAAACSSAGSSSADGTGGSTTSGAAADATSAATSAGVARAEAFLGQYSSPPATIGIATPLKAKPAPGKTFVWMQCDQPQCVQVTGYLHTALAAVGWNLKILNFQVANPASLVTGLKQALQYHPVAVSFIGTPYALWSNVVPQYTTAKVALIPMYDGTVPLSSAVPAGVEPSSRSELEGKIDANWLTAESGGTGKALLVDIAGLGASTDFTEGFNAAVSSTCPGCSLTTVQVSLSDVVAGKLAGTVVSALQRNPSIKYVISAVQPESATVPAALESAGITGIKLIGAAGGKQEIAGVNSGQLAMVTPTAINYGSWSVVDAALRYAEGAPAVSEVAPLMVITASSHVPASDTFAYPNDWEQQFEKLWLVG
jgi:ribose transport system substrate-binding protein